MLISRDRLGAALVVAMLAGGAGAQCFTAMPQPMTTVCEGTGFLLHSQGNGPGAYQWFRNGQAVPGATANQYLVNGAGAVHSGNYQVRFQRISPPGTCWSNPSTVQVLGMPTPTGVSGGGERTIGAPMTLSVDGVGPQVAFQWRKNGQDIAGATGQTLTISPVVQEDAGEYRCFMSRCGQTNLSAPMVVTIRQDAAAQDYWMFMRGMTATEIVRSSHLRNPNPRMFAVLAAIRRVVAKTPNMDIVQLSAFATQYDQALAAAYPQDPTLRRSMNFHTAVRFVANVNIPGVDAEIGYDVLRDLGLNPHGEASSRDRQMVAFQEAQVLSMSSRDEVARTLRDLFTNVDATGLPNPILFAAAEGYLMSLGIDVTPTRDGLNANYPEVAEAIALMPQTPEAFYVEMAANFPTMRARIHAQLQAVRQRIVNNIDELATVQDQYPTLESTVIAAGHQATVDAALARRQTDLLALARSRTILSFSTAAMFQGTIEQQQQATTLQHFSNVQIQFASSTLDSVTSGLSGAGSILSGIGGVLGADGPAGVISGVGSLASGISELLPMFVSDGPQPPSPEQQVLDEVTDLRNQVEEFRVEMVDRFNRIDAALLATYDAVTTGFDAISAQLQGIDQSLTNLQQEVSLASSNLSRFEQNLYGVLSDGFNIEFLSNMNTAIGWRERLGDDMSLTQFGSFEGSFWTYATQVSTSNVYAGPNTMPYDSTALTQLSFNNGNPIGAQINGLREFPVTLGLPRLNSQRTANPTSWSLNADTYAQLARENPWYFARSYAGEPTRVADVTATGTRAQNTMNAAKSVSLFNSLKTDYLARMGAVQSNFEAALGTFQTARGIAAANLWGGAAQTIAATLSPPNTVMAEYNINTTANGNIPTPLNGSVNAWNILPAEYKNGSYLGLSNRNIGKYHYSYRVSGTNGVGGGFAMWNIASNGTTYTSTIDVELWWNRDNIAPLGTVYVPGVNRPMIKIATRRFSFTMAPGSAGRGQYPIETFRNRWSSPGGQSSPPIRDAFFAAQSLDLAPNANGVNVPVWTATTIIDDAALATIRSEVNNALRMHQADYYNTIALALGTGADTASVRVSMDLASVNVRLMDAYLSLACPESFKSSDLLRGAMRGWELGLDRGAMQAYMISKRNEAIAMASGSNAPTVRPSLLAEATRRLNILNPELAAALDANRAPEYQPFMKWTLASLGKLQSSAMKLATDDLYLTNQGQPLVVPASAGVLVNDASQPAAIVTAQLVAGPVVGTLVLNPNGGFTYVPPMGYVGTTSFTYRARGELNTTTSNQVLSTPATVLIRVGACSPQVVQQPVGTSVTTGGTAVFNVQATGGGRLNYQWRKNGGTLQDGPTTGGSIVRGSDSPTLVIGDVDASDGGGYDCVITGPCGVVTTSIASLGGGCRSDLDNGTMQGIPDGAVTVDDLLFFLVGFENGSASVDLDNGSMTGTSDQAVTVDDLIYFITRFEIGC
jgi:Immunoglobulin domain/Bacterial Ig domain